jgi:hypothetical protein
MEFTTAAKINVVWDELTTDENGGSTILSYDLWRDDGDSGDYVSLFFTDRIIATSFTDLQVETSLVYRYKYRCLNVNGWGEFSDPGYLYAANVPAQSTTPSRVSFDSSQITVQMYAPEDTGGDDVITYELHRDDGTVNSAFVKVQTYADAGGEQA